MGKADKFAEKVMAELRRQDVSGPYTYNEELFRIEVPGGYFNLGNAYPEWERTSSLKRGLFVRRFVEIMSASPELPDSVDDARANLMLRVRELDYLRTMEMRYADALEGKGPTHSYQPLNEDFAVEVVYDRPQSISTIGNDTLERWGLSFEDALRAAKANLRDRTDGTFEQLEPGVFTSPWHDAYDHARVLLTELVNRLEVSGDPVALLPHRDHLLLTGSDDVAGLVRIAELAEPLLSEPRAETGRAVVWREGAWEAFVPPAEHPAHNQFLHLLRLTAGLVYADQTDALNELLHAAGEDIFVASVKVYRSDDSGSFSIATWAQDVLTLLPRADRIAFVVVGNDSNQVTLVGWDDAREIAGHLMEPTELRPERWRVESFPNDAELALLVERAADS